ncbi:Mpv17/PMP22 family protein [Pleurostoma richardsiae]|uniref:Mpv17/PMP22 family protein n=1 Tax=Pleurostoma richardsiae TaxID=41990 RepID=A0AA38SB87_9PEZI|nr:Mpv17/PMP22 family protein [Pleurostoma richardsiae]
MSTSPSETKGVALPPIVSVTLQAALMSGTSNILAQALTAYKHDKPFVIDWVPVFQFVMYTLINTPPNFLWQDFLESTFPAYHAAPTDTALASAASGDDKALDARARDGSLVEPRLSIRNTLAKTLLDQTAGAVVNTFLFSVFMHSIREAMAHGYPAAEGGGGHAGVLAYLISGRAVDYGRVDWAAVLARSREEFWSILTAGWRLWPFVSLLNFAFIKSVEGRNLVGGLAGMGWGVYMSMFAAR